MTEDARRGVRPLRPGDAAEWRRLWTGYQAHGSEGGREAAPPPPSAITAASWALLVAGTGGQSGLVAPAPKGAAGGAAGGEGGLAGFAHLLLHPATGLAGPACMLQDLHVDPPWRRQGIGRALLEAAIAEARAFGALRLHWQVMAENQAARRLYDRVAAPSGHLVYRLELGG